jgi:hypothetical protein
VTPERRRLAALAAVLVPGRAAALLARLDGPDGETASALAATLAAAPRRTRLTALAATLPSSAPAATGHPLLARLRLERGAAGRTEVRKAAASAPPPAPDRP